VWETLEEIAREGARRLLAEVLEWEVEDFLGRRRHERGGEFRGYRNGHAPEREVGTGLGAVRVRAPRVADVPAEVATEGYRSEMLPRYQRRTAESNALLTRLYLEGLSSGDFEPVFREFLGEAAPLSASTILRLKEGWAEEFQAWSRRKLDGQRYGYVWFDGLHLGCGHEDEHSVVLCVIGVGEDGTKELLALRLGYRESTESWKELLRDLRDRGLKAPLVGCGDGALGAWAALREIYPSTRHQRCWNHRVLNLQDKLPKRLQAAARQEVRKLWEAPTRKECEERRDSYVAQLREQGQVQAADCLLRDWDDFVTFYDFPKEHWIHLRTTNPIESVFGGVRVRTRVARRMQVRENALYLVFKVIQRLAYNWRALNGGATLMTLVLSRTPFVDGVMVVAPPTPPEPLAQAA
jgi:transposase-like protein